LPFSLLWIINLAIVVLLKDYKRVDSFIGAFKRFECVSTYGPGNLFPLIAVDYNALNWVKALGLTNVLVTAR
jgi:hypothetical protein